MKTRDPISVVGAGLAGSEAAWQLARFGVPVFLYEMRPLRMPPAHTTASLAELVCSNSFKSTDPASATGSLKHELEMLESLVLRTARVKALPAGAALAVDRSAFSYAITKKVTRHPLIRLVREEVTQMPAGTTIVATGPLTSRGMEAALSELVGDDRLHFYDAASPILDAESIDHSSTFSASRYNKGGSADYLNCPMNRQQYEHFCDALFSAERVVLHAFERYDLFQACQPIEEVARSSPDALRFGALKPVGITDPKTGQQPWAVVQLRSENASRTAWSLVGFQTNLRFAEQRRVFRTIPGLRNAQFLRYGVMHRNTFIDAPRILDSTLAIRSHPRVRLAGQITGTEGYLEAAATGLLAALNTVALCLGLEPVVLPHTTAIGSLIAYATNPVTDSYQPMHVNWGLVPPLERKTGGRRARYIAYAQRASDDLRKWTDAHPLFSEIDKGVSSA